MIGGAGFAVMAWREAIRRHGLHYAQLTRFPPAERITVEDGPANYPVSAEFYRINDAAHLSFSTRSLPPLCDTVRL